MSKPKFAIIDANAIIHRAFHALPPLVTKEGVLVNAVYGFANILLKVLKDIKPDYIAVCFDVAKKTFRSEIYPEYKAQRERGPQELYDQMAMVRELVRAFNMPMFEQAGYEADDLIGTIVQETRNPLRPRSEASKKQETKSLENIIVTGDLDTLQLIDDGTKVYTLRKGLSDTLIYDADEVRKRYGFGPEQVVDYKALRGDPSDNIPGVRGVGEKTASVLIQEFGSLEKLYEYVDKIQSPIQSGTKSKTCPRPRSGIQNKSKIKNLKSKIKDSVLQKLADNKEQAFMSKRLATIIQDVNIDFDLAKCELRPFNAGQVAQLFQQWNFKSLIGRIPLAEKVITKGQTSLFDPALREGRGCLPNENGQPKFQLRSGYTLIDSDQKFQEFIQKLSKQPIFCVDTETDGMDPFRSNLIGISFSWEEGTAWYLPTKIQNTKYKIQKITNNQIPNSNSAASGRVASYELLVTNTASDVKNINLERLKSILRNSGVKKVGHNIKFDLEALQLAGLELNGIEFDTMVASYLLNPGSRQHNLNTAVFTELGYEMTPIETLIGKKGKGQITMAEVELERVADYSAEDADYTWRLYQKLHQQLIKNDLADLMDKIENPLIPVLANIERNGVLIDKKFLEKMSRELELRIKNQELSIYKIAGIKFNVASPLQLKQILFDKLGIPTAGLSKTKTGISTAAGELEKLKGLHPIIDLIMDHRELSKLKNTYTDALPKLINPADGRVHTSFNQTVTATGRLSSSEPNLQNIPVRTELGRKIRQAFIAPAGYKIVAIDYSQIELRIAAHMSGDKVMMEAFNQKQDFHARTAAEVFEVPLQKVTPDMRRKAKEVNFGILYGLGPRGLAQRTGTSYDEALAFIEKYFEVYYDLKNYLEETIALAHEMEYVETLFGRKRYLPEINAEHQQMRAAAERMAVNHPLQGSAADLIKLAMIEVDKFLSLESPNGRLQRDIDAKMILQVHDELVFEIKDNQAEHMAEQIKDIMETVYKFKVPIVAEIGIGNNWGQCK